MLEAFNMFDKDGDGEISKKELSSVLHSLGQNMNEQELDEFIASFDDDGSGNIGFDEFLLMMAERVKVANTEEQFIESFRHFNSKGTGQISPSELLEVMQTLVSSDDTVTEKEAQAMIDMADATGNGKLNFYDYMRQMMQPN